MKRIVVGLERAAYPILIGNDVFSSASGSAALREVVTGATCALVSDSTVAPLYAGQTRELLCAAGAERVVETTFPAGESAKTLGTLEALYHFGVAHSLDRSSVVVALGGGVVGDVSGFFAATYLRGLAFVQVPTTLLALVDSSVGGKVAVDLPEGKNLVGAFHQPRLVLGHLDFLESLPTRELRCGLAEVVKYGVILDADFFALLSARTEQLLSRDPDLLEAVVARCCELKAQVVVEDERELGRRAILNYGHTFGHALESISGFSVFSHGEAVAIGMGMAADLAVALGLADDELRRRQDALLQRCGLATRASAVSRDRRSLLVEHMRRDKKVRDGTLRLVLPRQMGSVEVRPCSNSEAISDAVEGRLG